MISPLLAKHLRALCAGEWFEQVARPRLKGRCQLIRYADHAVIAFEDHLSGKRLLEMLSKRLGRYGLQLHPTKTRFVDFRFKRPGGRHPATAGTSSTSSCVGAVEEAKECRPTDNSERPLRRALACVTEMVSAQPASSVPGTARPPVTGDPEALRLLWHLRKRPTIRWYHHQLTRIWKKWLARRGRHSNLPWSRFRAMLARHPLPPAKIVHQYAVS